MIRCIGVILLTWQTTYFDLTPEERCFEVADRFNQFYPDQLQTLKAGELNGYGVVCVGGCGRVQKGQSGGPVLDAQGHLLGINTIHARPLFAFSYSYADGSQPDPVLHQVIDRYNWTIPSDRLPHIP